MESAQALAFVSRMFDTAAGGAVLWGDALLMKRFRSQSNERNSLRNQFVCKGKKLSEKQEKWRDSEVT